MKPELVGWASDTGRVHLAVAGEERTLCGKWFYGALFVSDPLRFCPDSVCLRCMRIARRDA